MSEKTSHSQEPRWMGAEEARATVRVGDLVELRTPDPHWCGTGRVTHCGPHAIQIGDGCELGLAWGIEGLRVRVWEKALCERIART